MIRVSTSQIYAIANVGMTNAQSEINKTQEQMSSGKRVLTPADDPVAATNILKLNDELARYTQYTKNIDSGTNSLNLEETTLQSVINLVQRMQELAVNAGNTSVLTKVDYSSLASEVESRTDELYNLLNTRNASGQYIFSGFQGSTQPFVDLGGGNYAYKGDDGQLQIKASASVSVAVSDSGKKLFVDLPSSSNIVSTSASPSNTSAPAASISAGLVFDQDAYDEFYPSSMVVSFNSLDSVSPPAANFTITEKGTGKVLAANQLYHPGEDIELHGVRFQIFGAPTPGQPAQAGKLPLGTFTPTDFTPPANSAITLKVGGVTETLTLDQPVNTLADLVTALGGDATYPNANPISNSASAQANQQKLQNLGITFDASGFSAARGVPISIQNGSASTTQVLGIPTQGAGTGAALELNNTGGAFDFSPPNEHSFTISNGNQTGTITLSQNVTDTASLVAAMSAGGNAATLTALGLSISSDGIITSPSTAPISISGGDAQLNLVMGINTLGTGTASPQGTPAKGGDTFFVDSSKKQNLLTTLANFSEALRSVKDTAESKAELSKIVGSILDNLHLATDSITSIQGEVGARMNTLDSAKDLNLNAELYTKEVLSGIESLDYAEASTRLSMQSLVLSAAQQSFVKVSQLSLFNYL